MSTFFLRFVVIFSEFFLVFYVITYCRRPIHDTETNASQYPPSRRPRPRL